MSERKEDRYLYRAKRMNNGKWVEGYYMPRPNLPNGYKHYIVTVGSCKWYEVDPSTICACTGKKDKNIKLIWENDIIKTKFFGKESGTGCNFNDYDTFQVVYKNGGYNLVNSSRSFPASYIAEHPQKFEVVGNVFDNIELLEVGE